MAIRAEGTGTSTYSLWSRGRATPLPNGRDVPLLNDRGEVVLLDPGGRLPDVPPSVAVWRDGVIQDVTRPSGADHLSVAPHALSNRGHVAVSFEDQPSGLPVPSAGVVWQVHDPALDGRR